MIESTMTRAVGLSIIKAAATFKSWLTCYTVYPRAYFMFYKVDYGYNPNLSAILMILYGRLNQFKNYNVP
jgi:hypothetical protein